MLLLFYRYSQEMHFSITKGSWPAVQLTDAIYEAQQAKFFPCGTKLIFCAKPEPTMHNRIGWIDISAFIQQE